MILRIRCWSVGRTGAVRWMGCDDGCCKKGTRWLCSGPTGFRYGRGGPKCAVALEWYTCASRTSTFSVGQRTRLEHDSYHASFNETITALITVLERYTQLTTGEVTCRILREEDSAEMRDNNDTGRWCRPFSSEFGDSYASFKSFVSTTLWQCSSL